MLEDLKEIRRIIDKFIAKYERQGYRRDDEGIYEHQDDEHLKEIGQALLKLKKEEGEDLNDDHNERWSRFDRWDGNDIY